MFKGTRIVLKFQVSGTKQQ